MTENTILHKNNSTILGGVIEITEKSLEENVEDFIRNLIPLYNNEFYTIGEYYDKCIFIKGFPEDLTYFSKLRIFGVDGDLELRRDSDKIHWRLISKKLDEEELKNIFKFEYEDFWINEESKQRHSEDIFHLDRLAINYGEMILWGVFKDGLLKEDIVGAAKLNYPIEMKDNNRAVLKYKALTYLGRPQFVWYYGLEVR